MQRLPITSETEWQASAKEENKSRPLFICEKDCIIPYITYQIKDNHVYLTMQCNTLNPHVETIRYDQYKISNSNCSINAKGNKQCKVLTTQDAVFYSQQHKNHLCNICKKDHHANLQNDSFLQVNSLNLDLNYNCKQHPNGSLVLYCKLCKISICAECATDKHNKHPTFYIKHLIAELKKVKLIEKFKIYEENYFHKIDSAYTQAQLELKNDYENHKSVNKELFDIARNIIYMWETLKECNDINLLSNVTNIVDNINTDNFFNYKLGDINRFQNYLKSNLVLNFSNINDWNTSTVASLSRVPMNNRSSNNNTEFKKNEEIRVPAKTDVNQENDNRIGNVKEFECVTTVEYEDEVTSLCKLNDDLYAAGVGSLGSSVKIHIIQYSNSERIHSLTGHCKIIWRWYWHKKTNYLLSLSYDADIRIWNYSNGNCIAALKGHRYSVKDIVELQSGDIITVSSDQSIKYWNMNTFTCFKTIVDAHSENINCVLLLSDQHLITGGEDKLWKIWKGDVNNKEDICNSICTRTWISSLLEVNNCRWWLGLKSGDIETYNINGFSHLGKLKYHTSAVSIMVLLSDGYLMSGSFDSQVIIWNITTLSCLQILKEQKSWMYTGWIEMRENEIMSGSGDKTVKKWVAINK